MQALMPTKIFPSILIPNLAESSISFSLRQIFGHKTAVYKFQSLLIEGCRGGFIGGRIHFKIDTAYPEGRLDKHDELLPSKQFIHGGPFPKWEFIGTPLFQNSLMSYGFNGEFRTSGGTENLYWTISSAGFVMNTHGENILSLQARAVISRQNLGRLPEELIDLGGIIMDERIDLSMKLIFSNQADD